MLSKPGFFRQITTRARRRSLQNGAGRCDRCTSRSRLPNLSLAVEIDQIEFKGSSFVYGVETLMVTW